MTAPMPSIRQQRGYTMLEMVLSAMLTTFITLVITQAYQANQQSYHYQTAIATMERNARFIAAFMVSHLALAESSVSGTSDTVNRRDTVTTVFVNDSEGASKTCAGANKSSSDTISATFNISASGSTFSLRCSDAGSTGTTNGNQELVLDVEHMRILYGEDTQLNILAGELPPAPSASIDRWVDADSVSDWDNVLAIQVSFMLRSENPIDLEATSRSYNLLDQVVTKSDGRLRYVFSFTVALGNRL